MNENQGLCDHLAGCAQCQALLREVSDDPALRPRASRRGPSAELAADEPALARLLEELRATPLPAASASGNTPELGDTLLTFLSPPEHEGDLGTLGPYRVLAELGRGGMGIVLLAYDPELRRTVALKVLPAHRADAKARARFVREAQAAAGIDHDHVVPVHAVANPADGPPYLVMQYVEGPTLRQQIQEAGRLDPQEAARICEQIGRGLAAAHHAGLIHRDIKPGNIILQVPSRLPLSPEGRGVGGERCRAKIMDFGLVRMTALPRGTTQEGNVPGTPEYMSPEQVREPDRIDARADIYSLGVTLYEALTGEVPFRGVPHMVLQQVLNDEPRPPRRLNDQIPRDLETICLHCLQKEPGKRYATAGALADDLRRFLAREPIRARPIRAWERAVKWARRRPAVAALLSLVVFVTALGFGLVTWQWQRAEAAGQVAADKATELEIKNYFKNIALAELALAAGDVGRAEELLDLCPEGLRGWEWHYLKRLRHGESLSLNHPSAKCVACSRDGRYIASGSWDGTVRIWAATAGNELFAIKNAHTNTVHCVVFSPDGQVLASTGVDKMIKIWDTQTGRLLHTLKGHTDSVWRLAFNSNGTRLASGSRDQTIRHWDLMSGREIQVFREHSAPMSGLAYSPDGQRLITAAKDGTVKILDAITYQVTSSFHVPIRYVHNAALSHDGRRLALASYDGTIKICDAATGQETVTLEGHTDMVPCSAWSPDGQRLASCGADATVRVWDTTSGLEALTLRGHTGFVGGLAFSPDGQRLFSAGREGTIKVWDATPLLDGQRDRPGIATLRGHGHRVLGVAFSPDGQQLVSAGWDGTVKLWETATGSELVSLAAHDGAVTGVAFSPDGRCFASSSWDETVKLWEATTGRELATLNENAGFVYALAFRPDGRQLAVANNNGKLTLRNPATGSKLLTLPGHSGAALVVAFSPDNLYLASAAHDGTMKIWDVTTEKQIQALRGHTGRALGLAFSPDGKYLASAGEDRIVKLWNTRTWEVCRTFQGHTNAVTSVAFSADSQRLASGSWDQTVRIWDVALDQEPVVLHGHAGYVWGVAFSPDGRLASCSGYKGKGEIKFWDRTLWDNRASMTLHKPDARAKD